MKRYSTFRFQAKRRFLFSFRCCHQWISFYRKTVRGELYISLTIDNALEFTFSSCFGLPSQLVPNQVNDIARIEVPLRQNNFTVHCYGMRVAEIHNSYLLSNKRIRWEKKKKCGLVKTYLSLRTSIDLAMVRCHIFAEQPHIAVPLRSNTNRSFLSRRDVNHPVFSIIQQYQLTPR